MIGDREDYRPVRPRTLVTLTSLTAAFPESIFLDLSTEFFVRTSHRPPLEIPDFALLAGDSRFTGLTGVKGFVGFVRRRFVGGNLRDCSTGGWVQCNFLRFRDCGLLCGLRVCPNTLLG